MDDPTFIEHQKAFAQNLQALLDSHGYSTKSLEKNPGIPNPTINRYLRENRIPRVPVVVKIAKFFHVSLDWLFGLEDQRLTARGIKIANLYESASADDQRVIDVLLEKYERGESE